LLILCIHYCQIALHNKPDLIESTLHPGVEDAHEQFIDTFDEMEGQLEKEMDRIKELRAKVDKDPGKSAVERGSRLRSADVVVGFNTYGCRFVFHDRIRTCAGKRRRNDTGDNCSDRFHTLHRCQIRHLECHGCLEVRLVGKHYRL
jgi:hypothetical protein